MVFTKIALLLTLATGYSQGHPAPCSKVDRILKAVNFAAAKHKDQKSNEDATIPFINHPIGRVIFVCWILHNSSLGSQPNTQMLWLN